MLRTPKGIATGDASGDYTAYGEAATAESAARAVTLKGDGGKVCPTI